MITMFYPLANDNQDSVIVLELYSVYKNERGDCVLFKIKSDAGSHHVLYSNMSNLSEYLQLQYIQINDKEYNLQEIMDNPDRIYSLMQQDILKDSIDNLP